MSRYLLDTGPAQKFINNDSAIRQAANERRRRGDVIGICVPVLGELWSGVEGSTTRERNLHTDSDLLTVPRLTTETWGATQ